MTRENTKAQYIKDFSSLIAKNHLEGILATAWDDGSPHLETVWRGYIAQGEFGWNPDARNVEQYKKVHAQREFGFVNNELSFLDDLEKAAFFFDGALVTDGRRNPAWGVKGFTLISLPDDTNPGSWSSLYKKKIDEALFETNRYEKINTDIRLAKQKALRNRYTLEVYEQTNHLINYPTKLILALHEYDIAKTNAAKQSALQNIKNLCAYFDVMRKNLEDVYSQTRFMSNPPDYKPDMNHHYHLAALTNNSDWLYLYEIPMVKKVNEWLSGK